MKHFTALLLIQVGLVFASFAADLNTRLAIGTFGLTSEKRDGDLADVVAAHLSTTSGFDLVERRELDAVLKEAGLGLTGAVRAKDLVRFGSVLRADQFLLGSSAKIDGTNRLFVRLVDARTGAIRAINVFCDTGGSLDVLANEIVDFVHIESKRPLQEHRDYLAIGVVQNLGVNNRFADFPAQMRGSVATKLSSKVVVLERDVISFLANEVQLNRSGLTEGGGAQDTQMQFGFWIVDGFYQSYEVTEPIVQLRLRIERVQGGQRNFLLQGKPDEQFFAKIGDVIGQVLGQPIEASQPTPPTRAGEITALEARGRQLVDFRHDVLFLNWEGDPIHESIEIRSAKTPNKVMSALDEAIRVFESILLLDPDNNAAKMRLAGCLLFKAEYHGGLKRDQLTERITRASEYYREVIATEYPEYANDARINLALACDQLEGVEMLRRFAAESTDLKAKASFEAYRNSLLGFLEHELPVEEILPQLRLVLLDDLTAVNQNTNETVTVNFDGVLDGYRFSQDKREEIINTLLPELLVRFPKLKPHILLAAASEQIVSNSPVIAQFMDSLRTSEEHPDSVWHASGYFTHLCSTPEEESTVKAYGGCTAYQRTFQNQQYALIIAEALARQRAAKNGLAPPLTELGKRHLAESYAALDQWQKALEIFEELPDATPSEKNNCRIYLNLPAESEVISDAVWQNTNDISKVELAYQCMNRQQWKTAVSILKSMGHRTVGMTCVGSWGSAFSPVLPAVLVDGCQTKADLPTVEDPMRFEIPEKPYVYFEPEGIRWYSIGIEGEDLWMATSSQIKRFHGDGSFAAARPSEMHEFERTTKSGSTCICVTSDFIWAGTYDDGLIELDRKIGFCRRYTLKDGLLLNGISGLKIQGQTLWIAYKNGDNGAVGTLDLKTHKFSSFTPNLSLEAGKNSQPQLWQLALDNNNQAPIFPITSMMSVNPDEMWFSVDQKGLRRFHCSSGIWESMPLPPPPPIFARASIYIKDMDLDTKHGLMLLATREIGSFSLDGEKYMSGGLLLYDCLQKKSEMLQVPQGLPSNDITAVAVDKGIAWVGGRGYIAVLDIQSRKVLRIAYISASTINQIKLSPAHAWVAISCANGDYNADHAGKARTGVYCFDRSAIEPADNRN